MLLTELKGEDHLFGGVRPRGYKKDHGIITKFDQGEFYIPLVSFGRKSADRRRTLGRWVNACTRLCPGWAANFGADRSANFHRTAASRLRARRQPIISHFASRPHARPHATRRSGGSGRRQSRWKLLLRRRHHRAQRQEWALAFTQLSPCLSVCDFFLMCIQQNTSDIETSKSECPPSASIRNLRVSWWWSAKHHAQRTQRTQRT